MVDKNKIKIFYMNIAIQTADLSVCERSKVGAIAVKNNSIIGFGYNGTPSKFKTNVCELPDGTTAPYVLHAEQNIICKLASGTESIKGAHIYCTLSPCVDCAKMLFQAGIENYYYLEEYRIRDGVDLLNQLGVNCSTLKNYL